MYTHVHVPRILKRDSETQPGLFRHVPGEVSDHSFLSSFDKTYILKQDSTLPTEQQPKGTCTYIYMYVHAAKMDGQCRYQVHVNERCRKKEERSKQGHTNNKTKQHSTPEAAHFS